MKYLVTAAHEAVHFTTEASNTFVAGMNSSTARVKRMKSSFCAFLLTVLVSASLAEAQLGE